jgi:hypothetical protein
MNTRNAAVLTGLSLAGLFLVYAIGRDQLRRREVKRDRKDVSRWEGEGGSPHPDAQVIDDNHVSVA